MGKGQSNPPEDDENLSLMAQVSRQLTEIQSSKMTACS